MRRSILAAVALTLFGICIDEARSEQGAGDAGFDSSPTYSERLEANLETIRTAPRMDNPDVIAEALKRAIPRDLECETLTSMGYRRLGRILVDSRWHDTADCEQDAVKTNQFAVYGNPRDIFVYTSGRYKGKTLREVDGRWIVFDGSRQLMDGDGPLVYTKNGGDPYEELDDGRLRLDGVEGAGEGFGQTVMYRNRFHDTVTFSIIDSRTSHFSVAPLDHAPSFFTYQRQCDGSFSKVSQPQFLDCGE